MKVLTVRLDDDLHARAVKAAEQDARSLNGELNWLIKAGLDATRRIRQSIAEGEQAIAGGEPMVTLDETLNQAAAKPPRPSRTVVGYSKAKQAGRERPGGFMCVPSAGARGIAGRSSRSEAGSQSAVTLSCATGASGSTA